MMNDTAFVFGRAAHKHSTQAFWGLLQEKINRLWIPGSYRGFEFNQTMRILTCL